MAQAPSSNGTGESQKEFDPDVLRRTVQERPPGQGMFGSITDAQSMVFYVAQVADQFEPWGRGTKLRDGQLRAFYPTEPMFLSGLGTIASRNSAFAWKLEGPPTPTARFQRILQTADFGAGWPTFITKLTVDLATQDYGAFYEIIRAADSPDAEVLGIANLDAARCYPTGIPEYPVVYQDRSGRWHRMAWYQVQQIRDLPATIEGLPGLQLCALTRMLRAVQTFRDIGVYIHEKVGGRNARAITLLKGVTAQQVEEAWNSAQFKNDARGFSRFSQPIMVGTVDPNADVGFSTFELASLPDGFDLDVSSKQYVLQMALAFMADYQDFAPLPGGGLGTSHQSEVLHNKSRGRGAGLFMKLVEDSVNWAVLPSKVELLWDEQDAAETAEIAQSADIRATTRATRIGSGELTVNAARLIAVDAGDLPQEIYDAMLKEDAQAKKDEQDQQQAAIVDSNQNGVPDSGTPQPEKEATINGGSQPQAQSSANKDSGDRPGSPKVEAERLAVEAHVQDVVSAAFAKAERRIRGVVSQ